MQSLNKKTPNVNGSYLWLSDYAWLLSLCSYLGSFSSFSKLVCIHSIINHLNPHLHRHRKEPGRLYNDHLSQPLDRESSQEWDFCLLCSQPNPWCLEQCLAVSRCSVSIYQIGCMD